MAEKFDSSNRQKWTVATFRPFYGKTWAGFLLKMKTLCLWGFILQPWERV